jgi:uncharacterized protein (TIGR03086 family)
MQALQLSAAEFAARVELASRDRWDHASACAGWSVYDLINHVNGGGHRYTMLMEGASAEMLAPTRTQDHVGDDPLSSFWSWQLPLARAFEAEGALARVVHHRAGDMSGGQLLQLRILELTLHSWDLARSLGVDDRLNPDLVDHLLEESAELLEHFRRQGFFAPTIKGSFRSPQDKLLAVSGRSIG